MKLENQISYVTNPQFSGGVVATATSGSTFASASGDNPTFGFVAGGLYVGVTGDLIAKTYDGSVLNFQSASGFLPGLFCAVSSSSSARGVLALR